MEDGDTTAVLPEDDGSEPAPRSPPARQDDAKPKGGLGVTVEPLVFFSMFSMALQKPLYTQYLWERISTDVGYDGTDTRPCNSSVPPGALEQEVETLTAHWNMYINLGGFAVGLVMVTLLGSWSDRVGRQPVLVIASLGLALQLATYLLVMYLHLPVAWFLLGRLLSGLTGDFNTIIACCFAYIADISDGRSLTFRVAVLEASLGTAGMLASAIGGPWRRAQGYTNPFWLALVCSLAAAAYAFLFVPESVTPVPEARFFTLEHHRAVRRLYCARGGGWRVRLLWPYLLCFFLVVTVHFGSRDLYVLYELSVPLCWGPELVGFGSAALHLCYLSSLLGLRAMQVCLEDSWVAVVGLVSNMASLVVISMASTTALMFTGYGLGFLFLASVPVLRSKMSKLVGASEQGALFASVACVEGLCSLVSSGVFSSLYPVTLPIMKGLPFLLAAGLLAIPMAVIGAIGCWEHRMGGMEALRTS